MTWLFFFFYHLFDFIANFLVENETALRWWGEGGGGGGHGAGGEGGVVMLCKRLCVFQPFQGSCHQQEASAGQLTSR